MKTSLKASIALVFCLAAVGAASAASSFTDPTGDSGVAPDISAVTVANDAAGNLAFTVRTSFTSLTPDDEVDIYLDTDNNGATGDDGSDYGLAIDSTGWFLAKWDGAKYVQAAASSASALYSAGVETFKINKADIGIGTAFTFWVGSLHFDANDTVVASDVAPDGSAVYSYTLTTAPPPPPPAPTAVHLTAGTPSFSPKAHAGAVETIRIPITRSDTGAGLGSGTAVCSVKIGSASVAGAGSVHSGAAFCKVRIPASAHGKIIHGTVKVHFRSATVTKAFSTRIA